MAVQKTWIDTSGMTIRQMKKAALDTLEQSVDGILTSAEVLHELSFEAVDEDGEFVEAADILTNLYEDLIDGSNDIDKMWKQAKKALKQIRNK